MTEATLTDQWFSDGDCEQCRKKPYCGKSCTAHKKYVNAYLQTSMINFLAGKAREKKDGEITEEWDELISAKLGGDWADQFLLFPEAEEEKSDGEDRVQEAGDLVSELRK